MNMSHEHSQSALIWRRRLVLIRGISISAFALLFFLLSQQLATAMPNTLIAFLLTLLTVPSLLFFLTQQMEKHQQWMLNIELVLDTILFLVFLNMSGGASNPVAFYLLLPILVASLSSPWWLSVSLWASTTLLLPMLSVPHQHQHHGVTHAMTHSVDQTHQLGMWLIFTILGLVLIALGIQLQRQWKKQQTLERNWLEISLQRERMYELAANQAHLAHEINTPLASLIWALEDIQALPENALLTEASNDLSRLEMSAQRIRDVLREGSDEPEVENIKLDGLLANLEKRLALIFPTAPRIEIEENSLNPALADSHRWQRILLNLGYNACDAGANEIKVTCYEKPHQQVIRFMDNGPQMATPQRTDYSMGLGLILIKTALAALGGELNRVTHAGWTIVSIELPITPKGSQAGGTHHEHL